jgi:hypothetical protein
MVIETDRGSIRRQAQRRMKYAKAGFALMAAGAIAGTGYAFLATNGNATTTITASSSEYAVVDPAASTFPTLATPSTSNTYVKPPTTWVTGGTSAVTTGMWTPILDQAIQETTKGDVALIDTTGESSGSVLVTLNLTNPAALGQAYTTMNIPIGVKEWNLSPNQTPTSSTTGAWTSMSGFPSGSSGPEYLNFSTGTLSFLLPSGGWYEIYMPNSTPNTPGAAGSFYTVSTSSGSLAPTFNLTTAPA